MCCLNVLYCINQERHKDPRVLRRREVSETRHALMLRALDLVGGRLGHLRCVGPVVLACQHVDGALGGVDGRPD